GQPRRRRDPRRQLRRHLRLHRRLHGLRRLPAHLPGARDRRRSAAAGARGPVHRLRRVPRGLPRRRRGRAGPRSCSGSAACERGRCVITARSRRGGGRGGRGSGAV
ncbi:MAG: hypothetical protein AVDCRST_MAG16-38, partial [uncultured Frankineae bacterium]